MLKGACEFLRIYEDVNPLQGHIGFFNGWASSARQLWKDQVDDDIEYLDSVLECRKLLLISSNTVSSSTPLASSAPEDWRWLLTAKQIEQRTEEWYSETKNLITASEIATLWKGPRTRAAMVLTKVPNPSAPVIHKQGALRREHTGPMDWGVRYEPVVKQILEETLGAKIHELGRIRHRSVARVAASPDGLFIESTKQPELIGTLVEIKCPPSRIINDKIPFDYWCQMQLQMEVCGCPSCEFVEVKFKELADEDTISSEHYGWITLEGNTETMELRYLYSGLGAATHVSVSEGDWVLVEAYRWEAVKVRRVTVPKDDAWFPGIQGDLETFWKDVAAARVGEWKMPEGKARVSKITSGCAIVDSSSDKEAFTLNPLRIALIDNEEVLPEYNIGQDIAGCGA
jgi:putative phage-type endonuclease